MGETNTKSLKDARKQLEGFGEKPLRQRFLDLVEKCLTSQEPSKTAIKKIGFLRLSKVLQEILAIHQRRKM